MANILRKQNQMIDMTPPSDAYDVTYGNSTVGDALDGVEDRLDANTFGTAVDVSGYNTAQNKYTCPSDGYLYLAANDTSGYVVANVSGSGLPSISHSAVNAGIRYNYNSLYVKKGMKIYISVSSGSITAYFFPIS